MLYDNEANHEIALTLTKKEIYEARMAIVKIANIKANDHTPTAKARVESLDALADKLEKILYTSK